MALRRIDFPRKGTAQLPKGCVMITDDGTGIAARCADRFADFGQEVVLVKHLASPSYQLGSFQADLRDQAQVRALLDEIRSTQGAIAGLIHLLPLAPVPDALSAAEFADLQVKSLYQICRAIEAELTGIAKTDHALVFSATAMGGQLGFGKNGMATPSRAGGGSVNGFMKCLGMEWPDVLIRTIDFEDSAHPEDVVSVLEGEMADPSGPFETGHLRGERYTWEPTSAPLDTRGDPHVTLDEDSVVLITGGARGITAAIAREIGERFRCHLVLLGRSPLPEDSEESATANRENAELKKVIMEKLAASGEKPTPKLVEIHFKKLMMAREIRENLVRIRRTGARVEYHSIDVRDHEAMSPLFADLYLRFGKIDGVVHGAGIIDDKLIKDKTRESFDRVFSTKVDSAFEIIQLLRPKKLKFLSFFASIASRYGNRGQSDYAAANEVLCKLATEMNRRWEARVFAVAWGPWSGIGMVSDLEKHLSTRGIALIDEATGCQMFVDEIIHGAKDDSEVIIAGGADNMITPSTNQLVTTS